MEPIAEHKVGGSHPASMEVANRGADLLAEEPKEDQLAAKVKNFMRNESENITELLGTKTEDPLRNIFSPKARLGCILGGGALVALGCTALIGSIALVVGVAILTGGVALGPMLAGIGVGAVAGGLLMVGSIVGLSSGFVLFNQGVEHELMARDKADTPEFQNFEKKLANIDPNLNRDAEKDLKTLFKSGHVSGEDRELYAVQLKHLDGVSVEQRERFLVRYLKIQEVVDTDKDFGQLDSYEHQSFRDLIVEGMQFDKLKESLPETLHERFLKDQADLDDQLPKLLQKKNEGGFEAFHTLKNQFTSFWEAEKQRANEDMKFLHEIEVYSKLTLEDKAEFRERFIKAREEQLQTLLSNKPYPWKNPDSIYHIRTNQLMASWRMQLQHAVSWAGKELSQYDLKKFPALVDVANEGFFKIANNPKLNYFERLEGLNRALTNYLDPGKAHLADLKRLYPTVSAEVPPLTDLEVVELNEKECERYAVISRLASSVKDITVKCVTKITDFEPLH